jgi:hypothetical protein
MMFSLLIALTTVAAAPADPVSEKPIPSAEEPVKAPAKEIQKKIEPFTGKVTGSKVRLRLQPNLDGFILKELSQGDLLIVTGEIDDFYAVMPDKNIKGYIYRAYVLDNVVEANNVNLRLDADIQSPIITQLSQGSKIKGDICAKNNKWLAVALPEDVRFYVAKDYINKAGDVAYFRRIETKRELAKTRLTELQAEIAAELKKPFPDICLAGHVNELKKLAEQNKDLPEYAEKAQALVKSAEEQYLELSHSYQTAAKPLAPKTMEKPAEVALVDTSAQKERQTMAFLASISFPLEQQEAKLLAQAIEAGNAPTKEAFYAAELSKSDELCGQLIPYQRAVKNRPGDFLLVDQKSKMPLAYLYSNRIDLAAFAGQTVKLTVAKRPNNNFALPAYFVLESQVVGQK